MATGLLKDKIVDGGGLPVPNVTVTATPKPMGCTRISDGSSIQAVSTTTSQDGSFQLVLEQDGNMNPPSAYWEINEQIPTQVAAAFGADAPLVTGSRVVAVRMPDNGTYTIARIQYQPGQQQITPNPVTSVAATFANLGATSLSTRVNQPFSGTIVVQVLDQFNQPVVNDNVTFTGGPGSNGGQILFPNGTSVFSALTDSLGKVTILGPTLTANGTADTFNLSIAESVAGLNLSIPVVIAAAAPGVPTGVTVTQTGTNAISVGLTAPTGTIDGYLLQIAENGIVVASQAVSAAIPIVYSSTSVLLTGHTYAIQVAAHSPAGGYGTFSTPAVTITMTSGLQVPGAPTIVLVNAQSGGQAIAAQWQAPATTGGTPITSYTMLVFDTGNVQRGTFTTANGTTLAATVTGLVNGTVYYVTVYATNAVGNGPQSAPSSLVTPATFPSTATGVAGTSNGNAQSVISWTPGSGNGSALTSQLIKIYQAGVLTGISQTVSGTATSATVTGLTNNTAYTASVTETNGVGNSAESTQSAAFTPQSPTPTVTGVSPNNGALAGGTAITVTGTAFTASATVDIAGVACTAVVVAANGLSLTCTTGNGTSLGPGAYDLEVTTAGGSSPAVSADLFTYNANANVPVVTSLNVRSGSTAGGTAIHINGSNFVNGGAVTAVHFGTINQAVFTVSSDILITCNTPAASAGTGEIDVTVTNGNGVSATVGPCGSGDRFQYQDAVYVTSISPTSGPPGTVVTLTGLGFTGASSAHVGATSSTFSVTNNTTATVTVGSTHATGKYHINITQGGVTSANTCHDIFNISTTAPTRSMRRMCCPEVNSGQGGSTPGTGAGYSPQVQNYEEIVVQPQQLANEGFAARTPPAQTIAQLKAINPALKVYLYSNGGHYASLDNNPPPPGYPNPFTPPADWFLYDALGNKTYAQGGHKGAILPLLNPQSRSQDGHGHAGPPGWKSALFAAAHNDVNNPYDGMFIDVMGQFSVNDGASLAGNPPIDPVRSGVYTATNYVGDQAACGVIYENAGTGFTGSGLICNGLEKASTYLNSPTNSRLISGATGLKGGMFEIYMKDADHQPIGWPGVGSIASPNQFYGNTTGSYANWYTALDDAMRVQQAYVMLYCKLYTHTTPSQDDQWMRIAVAMLLLSYQGFGSCSLSFQTNAAGGTADMSGLLRTGTDGVAVDLGGLSIGQPVSAANVSGNVFYRQFTNGYVFLNTDITGGNNLLGTSITSGTKHAIPISLPASTPSGATTTGWTDVGAKIVYDTTQTQYPATDYPAGAFLGTQNYADGASPTVPPNNALILRNY